MSDVRERLTPLILQLLRQHDSLPVEETQARMALQRRILFLMDEVRAAEFEESYHDV